MGERRRPSRATGADRGQSAVIGFSLIFGVVVLLLVVLQVTAVPTWNQAEEFDHNTRVQGELEQFRDDAFAAAETDRITSESISLGTHYPTRPFLLNPPDPSGTIETTAPGVVRLGNVTAAGEAGDYWNGTTRTFTTRHLRYRPNYNEYDNAPVTVFENTLLYNRFGDRAVPVTATRLVRGEDITLLLVNGSLSTAGTNPYDLEATPLSAPSRVTSVEAIDPLVLSVPTTMGEATWREALRAELAANGGNVRSLSVTPGDPYGTLTLRLAPGTYDLRMGMIGVGTRQTSLGAHYLTRETARETRVETGTNGTLSVQVRDRLNNPVSGVTVNASVVSGPGAVSPVDPTTDDGGQATFAYSASTTGTATVEVTFGTTPGDLETVTFSIQSVDPATGGGGGDATGPLVTDVGTNRTTASGDAIQQGDALTITANATDFERGGTDVYAVEWWSNRSDPGGGPGSGSLLVPVGDDDEFDSVEETANATVDTGSWTVGTHTLSVRARDAAGNWGPNETYLIRVTSGGGGNAAASVTVNGPVTAPSAGTRFRFDVTVTQAVTLESAAVDTTAIGGPRDALMEVSVNGTNIYSGGGSYISDGTAVALTDTAISGTSTIQFSNFASGGNPKLPPGDYTVSSTPPAGGQYLSITLNFADGSSKTVYFSPV